MSFGLSYIPAERLYRVYWVEMGNARSYARLSKYCKTNGIVHPKTGKAPGRMGVWKAVNRWAVNHVEKAYEIMNEGLKDSGEVIDRERFMQEMKEKVLTSYQSNNFARRWAKAMGMIPQE